MQPLLNTPLTVSVTQFIILLILFITALDLSAQPQGILQFLCILFYFFIFYVVFIVRTEVPK